MHHIVARSGSTGRGARRDERGQVAMWLVVVVAFALVGLGTTAYARLAKATDEVSRIQTAADAAALAGAQAIVRDAPNAIREAVLSGSGVPCGLGREAAQDFAARNDATLTRYCYYPESDRVEVTTRSNAVTESGSREERSAVAELGITLGPCVLPEAPPEPSWSPPPSSSPTPSGTESPTPTPTPTPDDVVGEGHCGDIGFQVTFPGAGGGPVFGWGELHITADPTLKD
ncbi:hypothetical protein H9L10_13435 [Phycicoccus endophyticus]|uniref:Uncharacterized protein n=1 Tax=Phycicoccus endophyticus TaxID=1690220 RepID=A0A7G9R0T6_9MICO|nr:pilus assembly protein TadG-related protein [Phycicoccus endophyticus]NHI19501.1 hypothetical protein [Phycicoccus endophyticus]QNN49211.1 hypothetical protein H9L10_13435 [Phycicoccus endophyticus]GGL39645.1 hypothetical protein GCM10012283_22720 [Phycicoccus endophyticus]